ncbi:AAA family ATPase [Paenibacillus marinisediminis]
MKVIVNGNKRTVYVISGPAGVGKSATSQALVRRLCNSAYVSGDDISHMHINGRMKPWESQEELSLIWNNILHVTRNFVEHDIDVVVDYVAFPDEAKWFKEQLKGLNVLVVYVVLWTDKDTLLSRDALRDPECQMGERCLILIDEFMESGLDPKHLLDTSTMSVDTLDQTIDEIINFPKYRLVES